MIISVPHRPGALPTLLLAGAAQLITISARVSAGSVRGVLGVGVGAVKALRGQEGEQMSRYPKCSKKPG